MSSEIYKDCCTFVGMDTRQKVLVIIVVLFVLVFGLYFFTDWFSKVTGYLGGEDEKEALAICLDERGVEFFYSIDCAECERQAAEFGEAMELIYQTDCGDELENCSNLREVPAWYIDNEFIYGFIGFEELKWLSGCE